MKTNEFKTIVLTADPGMYLTRKQSADPAEAEIATTAAIGKNDSPDNWKEITAAEADELRAAREAAIKEKEAQMLAEEEAAQREAQETEPTPEQDGFVESLPNY